MHAAAAGVGDDSRVTFASVTIVSMTYAASMVIPPGSPEGAGSTASTGSTAGRVTHREPSSVVPRWNASVDIGLLVLRLVLGGTFVGHGLQKVFGLFDGPGIDGFAQALDGLGFRATTVLAWVTGLTELVGGALVLLGATTPLAAAGLLGVMINVVLLKFDNGFFAPAGFELDFALGGLAAGLILTGAGRLALDSTLPLFRRPGASGPIFLAVGVAVALLVHFLLRA